MAEQSSLREYQRTLSARLLSTQSGAAAGLLGVEAGGCNWLLDLTDIGETLPPPACSPVPLTRPWLIGVASIRGNLHTLIDIAAFAGRNSTLDAEHSRVVLVADRYRAFCGFLVDRVLGLFRESQFDAHPPQNTGLPWLRALSHHENRTDWLRPDIPRLIHAPDFLNVGR